MNRLLSLSLAILLLFTCTSCVGRAASSDGGSQPAPLDAPAQPVEPEEAEETEAPEPDAEPDALEESYVRIIDPYKPMVALTFDDGPDEIYSNQILDILEENHALATFFEVGRNVADCPQPVTRMAEMGCEVASHSNAHKDLSKLRKKSLLRDLDEADEAFILAGAPAPTLVRPPYGAVNKTVKTATGRSMVTWTVDTEDWRSRDAQTVIDYVQNYGDLDGEIILMHSIYDSTVQAVAELVPWLQEQGYQLVTVTELMAYYYGELPQPDHFYGYTYFSSHARTDSPLSLAGPEESAPAETEEVPEEPADLAQKAGEPAESPEEPEQDAEWTPTRVMDGLVDLNPGQTGTDLARSVR